MYQNQTRGAENRRHPRQEEEAERILSLYQAQLQGSRRETSLPRATGSSRGKIGADLESVLKSRCYDDVTVRQEFGIIS